MGGPRVGMSIWKRFVLPTSKDDIEIMPLESTSSSTDSPSLDSCGI